ncbi:hypothetical protein PF010_g7176 [Phytophthora fragariae]|uniref:Uncharacterized protein n=1 Tax=Phytophthora fragariae TaxID=53985 RepID=A0A6A3Z5N6_9STRA|nr:hypothetical protein PF003_g23565 [Phytophthora fragariae]KAE9121280.1 hypothetical protein PF010_g7176 [Phytophthora fragariae]KAE9230658.1 hypothetical protein PF002_g12927 [Phytophthora fragariae]
MLRRIKAVLGHSDIFSKQAALVGSQEFQREVLELVNNVRKAVLHLFTQRFRGMSFDLVWITFLDPRFHKMKLLAQSEIEEAKKCLVDAAALAVRNSIGDSATPVPDARARPANSSPSDDTAAIWDDLLGSDDEDVNTRTDPTFQKKATKLRKQVRGISRRGQDSPTRSKSAHVVVR